MKPEEMENKRYKKENYCEVMLEEKIMFGILNNWAQSSCQKKEDIKILDIGCGSGLITKKIQQLGYTVKGLDFSRAAINKAIANGVDAELCNLDEKIDKQNEEFNVIWAGDIIEHVFDPIGLLREANRVLKKNGIIILSIPSDVGLVTRLKIIFGISYQAVTYKKHGFHKHHTFFTLDLIKYMLNKNNFTLVEQFKVLNTGKRRFSFSLLPASFYNELVICAKNKL